MGNDSASFLSDEINRLSKINAALLGSLESIVDHLDKDWIEQARAIIAAAKGIRAAKGESAL